MMSAAGSIGAVMGRPANPTTLRDVAGKDPDLGCPLAQPSVDLPQIRD
jgi:hypothetical protein